MKKISYPESYWKTIAKPHNITEWINAFQEILDRAQTIGKNQAIKEITQNWENEDVEDFLSWMKFYEGFNHLKYKQAQQYVPNLISTIPGSDDPGVVHKPDPAKQLALANHKKKIISRLDSLEKLVRSDDLSVTGVEISDLIKSIHDLKSKFYNLKLASIRTYDDIVVQSSNKLLSKGFVKSANLLFMVQADENVSAGDLANRPTENDSNATPANNTQQGYLEAPQLPLSDVDPLDLGNAIDIGMSDDSLINLEFEIPEDKEIIKVTAQELSADQVPTQPVAENIAPEETVESIEPTNVEPELPEQEEISLKEINENSQTIDSMLENAFGNVTPEMIMKKLEEVSQIFKTKEIPRQLAIVDFMLDKLGMSTFFPQLSEASGKAIESSNYISTRIDEVLNYLRGTIKSHNINLVSGEGKPAADVLIQNLKQKQQNKDLKQQQKLIQDNTSIAPVVSEQPQKETPVIELPEQQSTEVTQPPATHAPQQVV